METHKRNVNNALLLSLLSIRRKKKQKRPKRFWVREIYKNRIMQGAYHNLLKEMTLSDDEKYFNYIRMCKSSFDKLLNIVQDKITKVYCVREPISAGERLAITLRYLASGDSMMSISYAFRVAPCTVSNIIKETCNVIWNELSNSVFLLPNEASWLQIAHGFESIWQLPYCVGALDGKHVIIQAPAKSGSTFFNYKGSHSIVLLAVCDAEYTFTMVDIGAAGRHSDGGIFKYSNMGQRINSHSIGFPAPCLLGNGNKLVNYYLVADEAFTLTNNVMRPYGGRFHSDEKRIFNYRLSRGRRVIENCFGILAARWRIFRKPLICSVTTSVSIIKAAICLHSFLIKERETNYWVTVDREIIEEDCSNLSSVKSTGCNMYSKHAEEMRQYMAQYFMSEGAVSFQWNK